MRTVTKKHYFASYLELSVSDRKTVVERWAEAEADNNADHLTESVTYWLAEAIGYPGGVDYGQGDFPGIDGITDVFWGLYTQGSGVHPAGELTPKTAPKLPWGKGMVSLCVRDWEAEALWETWDDVRLQDERVLLEAWEAIKDKLFKDLQEEDEYLTSEEAYLEQVAEGTEYEVDEYGYLV